MLVTSPLVLRTVKSAQQRLLAQAFLGKLTVALAIATGVSLLWFVAQPLLLEAPAPWLRWAVLAGSGLVALVVVLDLTRRSAPSWQDSALAVDQRFDLRERVVTLAMMPESVASTSAAHALRVDAEACLKTLKVAEKFPLQLHWTMWLAPLFLLGMLAVMLWWNPSPISWTSGGTVEKPGQTLAKATPPDGNAKKPQTPEQKAVEEETKRDKTAKMLAELDAELKTINDKHAADEPADSPQKALEKTAELTKLEEKAIKFKKEKELELRQLADKLGELSKLTKTDDFKDGPAKELTDALAKGDLEKAEDEIDELKKKTENDELTRKEEEKLAEQLDKVKNELTKQKDEVERLNREKDEKQDELEKEKEKAKEEGRDEDAEQLDRELEKLEPAQPQTEQELKDLAEQLGQAQQAMEKGDKQEAAKAMAKARKTMQRMKKDVDQLGQAQQKVDQLKRERQKSAQQCQKPGDQGENGEKNSAQAQAKGQGTEPGDELQKKDSNQPNNGGIGSGARAENKEAKVGSEETRIRSLQDLKGKQSFAGLTKGDGFVKKTEKELGQQIQRAAQEAPNASDVQTLPRDARDSVAEYFKKLGGGEGKK